MEATNVGHPPASSHPSIGPASGEEWNGVSSGRSRRASNRGGGILSTSEENTQLYLLSLLYHSHNSMQELSFLAQGSVKHPLWDAAVDFSNMT